MKIKLEENSMPEANTNTTPAAPATPAAGNAATEVVSKAAHDELAGRMGSTMQQNEALKKQIAELTAKDEAAKKAELEKNGEYQKIAEAEKEARAKAENERDEILAKSEVDKKRFDLGIAAKNAGITDVNDALALINVTELKEGDTIEKAVEKLKSEKPYLFANTSAPLPHGARPGTASMTRSELLKDLVFASKLKRERPAEYDRIMAAS
jgi:hypothetical protein